jgi:signal peptidase I
MIKSVGLPMIIDSRGSAYQYIAQDLVKESLATHGFARLRVISDSMVPFLDIDDIVLVEHFPMRDYRRGDIVVTVRNNEFITHRLIRITRDKWYTKGDRFHTLDEPIAPDEVVGKVTVIERRDSHIDLNCPTWRITNRYRALLAYFEVKFYKGAKWLHRKLLPKEQDGGVN